MIYITFEDVVWTFYYILGINYINPREVSTESLNKFITHWIKYLEKKNINCVYVSNKADIKTFARDYEAYFDVNKDVIRLKKSISFENIFTHFLNEKPKVIFSIAYDMREVNKIINMYYNYFLMKEIKRDQLRGIPVVRVNTKKD